MSHVGDIRAKATDHAVVRYADRVLDLTVEKGTANDVAVRELKRQAEAYEAAARQARSDADRAEVARRAAAAAAKACGRKGGRATKVTLEGAPLPASLKGGLMGMRGWSK